MKSPLVLVFALTAAMAGSTPALGQEHQHSHEGMDMSRLGKVHFETSCSPSVVQEFDRAMALLHSFWFSAALDAFNGVAKADPACGIAHWGAALSIWGNPFGGVRTPDMLKDGQATVERGKAAGAKTQRERDYLAAVELLYKDAATVPQRARTLAYEKAMEQVYQKYPDDDEAAAFYALALAQTAPPTDKTYANQLKAAAILEPIFKKQPDHPGVAHYIIHSYDVPPLAQRAIEAARRYAKIAPAAPHALHMPSHTFTRLGYWEDSIDTNIASAESSKRNNSPGDQLHAYDYLAYAYLQTAQDAKARQVMDTVLGMREKAASAGWYGPAGMFSVAAVPARYALERGKWQDAAAVQAQAGVLPFVEATTHFARGLGAARGGDLATAKSASASLASLQQVMLKGNDQYWAEQADIQRRAIDAWIAWAEGRRDEGIATMRSAAAIEDGTEKSAITPGPLAPVHEMLGEMLIEAGKPTEALAEFEINLTKEPHRFRSVYGAGLAAERAGDAAKARSYYAQLAETCAKGDPGDRPELAHARSFATSGSNGRD